MFRFPIKEALGDWRNHPCTLIHGSECELRNFYFKRGRFLSVPLQSKIIHFIGIKINSNCFILVGIKQKNLKIRNSTCLVTENWRGREELTKAIIKMLLLFNTISTHYLEKNENEIKYTFSAPQQQMLTTTTKKYIY